MAEILSGGLTWGSIQQAIVTMDKEGHPLTCCNPVTGECLGGGGSSDFSTAEVTITGVTNPNQTLLAPLIYDGELMIDQAVYDDSIVVPLYKGGILLAYENAAATESDIISGNVTINDGMFRITGDCNIKGYRAN